ncbi:MAG TPA: right-handed parallel beta-helix repeat-containing protein [Mucilaginibacter sp.]|nr:right-handed parallel beta-helix repeat-containing protein [Mucilaginibacter sp.]
MEKLFYAPARKLHFLIIMILSVLADSCAIQAQEFRYKTVPPRYLPSASALSSYRQDADALKQTAYDLTQSLPQGYVTDGSADYTTYIQTGINNKKIVLMPNFPILINDRGLNLGDNSTVIFQPNSKLIFKASALPSYQILRIFNVQNVTVYFPVIQGDRKVHIGNKGEWGMGISIAGATNVKIVNPKVYDCWGDGIYIGKQKTPSKNIQILYADLDNCRRNGISVVSVDSLSIVHPLASNINGTDPQAGIDIEPNNNGDVINNISIDSPVTFNSRIGISISIWAFRGQLAHDANITIRDHVDDGSDNSFFYYGFRDDNPANGLKGQIKIINPKWKNSRVPYRHSGFYNNGPKFDYKNVSITDNSSSSETKRTDIKDKLKNDLRNEGNVVFH